MDFKGFYKELIFDVDKEYLQAYEAKQGDTKSRGFYVTVYQNNVEVPVTTESMTFYAEKPDGTRVYQNAVVDGEKFRIDLKNQVFAVPGIVRCELTLKGANGEKISSKTFKIKVYENLINSIVSKDERGIIDDALELVEDYIPRLELIDVDLLENYQSEVEKNKVKIATVEKEIHDYKKTISNININQEPKQSISGYGIISLPPNAANGQVSGGMRGETLTNLVDVGEFTVSRSEDGINTTKTIQTYLKANTTYTFIYNIKEKTNNLDLRFVFVLDGGETKYYNPGLDTQGVHKFTRIYNKNIERIQFFIGGKVENNGQFAIIDNVMILEGDYTNRPIKYINGTKSTIGSARIKSIGKNLCSTKDWVVNNEAYVIGDDYISLTNKTGALKDGYLPLNLQMGETYTLSAKGWTDDDNKDNSKMLVLATTSVPLSDYKNEDDIVESFSIRFNGITTSERRYRHITLTKNFVDAGLYLIAKNGTTNVKNIQLERGDTATEYEPYKESTAYVIAKDENNKIVNLNSLPNGVTDEIDLDEGKLIKKTKEYILQTDDFTSIITSPSEVDLVTIRAFDDSVQYKSYILGQTLLEGFPIETEDVSTIWNFTHLAGHSFHTRNDRTIRLVVEKGTTLQQAREQFSGLTLIYQLAEPEVIPVQVSGSIVSNPNGTIYVETITTVAGVYNSNMLVTYDDLPIKEIEKITKIDYETGLGTDLDVSAAVIAEDRISFTHPDLSNGDIVFFEYLYDVESTQGECIIEYYDSRYVIKDKTTGQFYKWNVVVDNGTPSIELEEV